MPRSAPRHIVVIDDDPTMQDVLHELLTDEGYRVTCLRAARTAYATIQALEPDLLLLDVPFGGGLTAQELIERLWRNPATQAMPVVVSSADSRALHAHAQLFQQRRIPVIDKPFDLEDLLSVIEQQWA